MWQSLKSICDFLLESPLFSCSPPCLKACYKKNCFYFHEDKNDYHFKMLPYSSVNCKMSFFFISVILISKISSFPAYIWLCSYDKRLPTLYNCRFWLLWQQNACFKFRNSFIFCHFILYCWDKLFSVKQKNKKRYYCNGWIVRICSLFQFKLRGEGTANSDRNEKTFIYR